jgi:hypothetical protein
MASCLLFHGPGARLAACEEAAKIGRLLAPPFGDGGLNTETAREVVDLLLMAPINDQVGVVIVGPMDEAVTLKAQDVLLKSIEEFRGDLVQPILWAHDLGSVAPTIRSRCLERWSPERETEVEDNEEITTAAWNAVTAALEGNQYRVIEAVRVCSGEESTAKILSFLKVVCDCLSVKLEDPKARDLWGRIRSVAKWRNPTFYEVAAALLGD